MWYVGWTAGSRQTQKGMQRFLYGDQLQNSLGVPFVIGANKHNHKSGPQLHGLFLYLSDPPRANGQTVW